MTTQENSDNMKKIKKGHGILVEEMHREKQKL